MRNNLSTFLKIGITILGLFLVIRQVDFNEVWQTLLQVHLSWMLAGLILVNISLVVRAYRWSLLLRGIGIPVKLSRLVELYFIGNFFNAFLPSGFGGDVVRILEIARKVPASTAAGTVILDRLTGLTMLFFMALFIIPFRPDNFPNPILAVIIIGSAASLIGGFIILEGSVINRLGRWLPGKLSLIGDGPLARLYQAVQLCGRQAIWKALAVSFLFNLILSGWWLTSGLALDQNVPFFYYVLIMPVLSIPLLIPSVSGLGPRELIAPTLFMVVGVSAETAVSLSLLVFVITRLAGLFGAPIYVYATIRDNRVQANQV